MACDLKRENEKKVDQVEPQRRFTISDNTPLVQPSQVISGQWEPGLILHAYPITEEGRTFFAMNPNQSVVSPLNLYRSPCVAACLAPESAIPNWSQVIQAMHVPISRIHPIGYLVEDGITSSVHAKHTFSCNSIMLRIYGLIVHSTMYIWIDHRVVHAIHVQ